MTPLWFWLDDYLPFTNWFLLQGEWRSKGDGHRVIRYYRC